MVARTQLRPLGRRLRILMPSMNIPADVIELGVLGGGSQRWSRGVKEDAVCTSGVQQVPSVAFFSSRPA